MFFCFVLFCCKPLDVNTIYTKLKNIFICKWWNKYLCDPILFLVEDLERNDGSADKPYYMGKDLMNILGKKNKKVPKEEKDDD